MKNRLERLAGTPARVRVRTPTSTSDKVDLPRDEMEDVVPVPVRIEVAGGRSSTASAMRAARVQNRLEEVGGRARTVALEGEHATLEAEADRRQILHVASLPFVRRISAS